MSTPATTVQGASPQEANGRVLRYLHGRAVNTISDVYKLPADKPELDRLSQQHKMWCMMMGGLYPPKAAGIVDKLLSHKDEGAPQPAVLDVGTGPGSWAVDMALAFPHARVVGLDLCPGRPENTPWNCSFVTEDVIHGLHNHAESFDVIHCRTVAGHVRDPRFLVKSIGTCLRPGGLFIFSDGNIRPYSEQKEAKVPASEGVEDPNASWFARLFAEKIRYEALQHHEEGSTGEMLARWLTEESQFEFTDMQEYYSPINWPGDGLENGEEIGRIQVITLLAFLDSTRPWLLETAGMLRKDADALLARVRNELSTPTMKLHMKWNVAWAVKKLDA